MSSDDQRPEETNETREQRLRIDVAKVDVARLRLAAIDRSVFATAGKHHADAHDRLIAQTVAGLFGHG